MVQSFRVLLVEDDDSLRSCLGEFLASHGWEVGATGHAMEALRLMQTQRFDFSLLDFHLPGMTGMQLFQRLAAMRPLPAILMSGLATAEEAAAAQHAGFFAFLRKPLDLARLRQSLELLIRTHFGGPLVQHFAHKPGPGKPTPPSPPAWPCC
ncbi:MAG: response regulator [Planctomycetes bacterium]|nr:response regulator [Planctomycetota bacterium]